MTNHKARTGEIDGGIEALLALQEVLDEAVTALTEELAVVQEQFQLLASLKLGRIGDPG